jgi:SSS family solute:Na+ symporter
VILAWGGLVLELAMALVLIAVVPLVVTFAVPYDEERQTTGLTSGSIDAAGRGFKGGEPNEAEGERVLVSWKQVDGAGEVVRFSGEEMRRMSAREGDLVYISDRRRWLGGLKSIHSVLGPPHEEAGVVHLSGEQIETGLFVEGRVLVAEKEM